MRLMKTDMAGGAAVIAVMSALAALGVRARVTGLVAAAENMPSGSAMRPGDIITTFGGRTVEVLNTDAEGRLVLADLLAYARATLDPDVTVDLATLTGAARIALGASTGALYASEDALAEALATAGTAAGEPLWRMPMPADYASALTSATADLAHVPSVLNGARNGQAGSIVAAMFLREFTGGCRWAHLDIAGPARGRRRRRRDHQGRDRLRRPPAAALAHRAGRRLARGRAGQRRLRSVSRPRGCPRRPGGTAG